MDDATAPLDLIGTAEAASLLRKDTSTITRWAKGESPRLPAAAYLPDVGPNGVLLFHRRDVLKLADELREQALATLPGVPEAAAS